MIKSLRKRLKNDCKKNWGIINCANWKCDEVSTEIGLMIWLSVLLMELSVADSACPSLFSWHLAPSCLVWSMGSVPDSLTRDPRYLFPNQTWCTFYRPRKIKDWVKHVQSGVEFSTCGAAVRCFDHYATGHLWRSIDW